MIPTYNQSQMNNLHYTHIEILFKLTTHLLYNLTNCNRCNKNTKESITMPCSVCTHQNANKLKSMQTTGLYQKTRSIWPKALTKNHSALKKLNHGKQK